MNHLFQSFNFTDDLIRLRTGPFDVLEDRLIPGPRKTY